MYFTQAWGGGIVSEGSRRRELVTLILVSRVYLSLSWRYWSFVPQISSSSFRTCLRARGCQDDGLLRIKADTDLLKKGA